MIFLNLIIKFLNDLINKIVTLKIIIKIVIILTNDFKLNLILIILLFFQYYFS